MVNRFLITTAQKQTWKPSEPIIFLGDWCKLYKKKDYWEKLDYKTKDYHWDDRNMLYKDFQYLHALYEKIIISCSDSLNRLHKVNHSNRYWKILIGPWLFHFIQIIFDRWQMIQSLESNKISETIVLKGLNKLVLPLNFQDFSELYSSDLWNHWIYAEIIQHLGRIPVTEVLYKPKKKLSSGSYERIKIKKLFKKVVEKYSFITQNNKYFFFGNSFTKSGQLKLELALNQTPSFYDFGLNKEIFISEGNRNLFKIDFSRPNKFESFLLQIIPLQIPKYYLEGYSELIKECKKRHWPTNPKHIITSSPIITSDIFKFWTAEKTEKGSKLIVSQHGGHYGVGKWNASEDHEIDVSDIFLSWGWKAKGVKSLSSSKLINFEYKTVTSNKSDILMALGLTQRYSYWLYSIPTSSQWKEYLDDQVKFVDLLPQNIKKFIKIRLSPSDYKWSHKQRMLDKLPFVKFDNSKNTFQSSVANSRVFIGTYNATTFLETFSANIPTIIFWNPKYSEIRKDAEPYFKLLYDVGIMHYSPESAANHLTNIWGNIDDWWNLEETQSARLSFINQYAKTSSNWINEWKLFLQKF
jgi:putative transferase (TIGR04331 family)